jgi:ribose 5-phosphate isomerase A
MNDPRRAEKIEAAERSLQYVQSGMAVGLGSGSTAAELVRLLGERVRKGLKIRAVASSEVTGGLANAAGIPLVTLAEAGELDVTIDGADEVDPRGRMIKGRGGALLREKVLASASRQLVIIIDGTKSVPVLGARPSVPLPVEVTPFAVPVVERALTKLGATSINRRAGDGGSPFVTDGGNHILDCHFGALPDPEAMAARLDRTIGVVEHGLFVEFSPTVIVAGGG